METVGGCLYKVRFDATDPGEAIYQADYGVGRYVSLGRIVIETRASYYDSLQTASARWRRL